MCSIDALTNHLINDSVVFFVGSGVSCSSCLPSAEEILRGTCQKLLPSLSEEQMEWILNGQPEVVYSILLECCHQDAACLDMWNCLSPANWKGEYRPEANFEHCFIAAYSMRAGVPIFTVNYDTMFEDACEKLGLKKGTDYAVVTECAQIDSSKDVLYICKLHGDIGGIGDCIDPSIFKTTMAEITKKNGPWLDYLFRLMETKHLCFAGYSGRDIDYYPLLKEKLNSGQGCPSFWTLENKKDEKGNVIKRDLGWGNAIAITSGQVIEKFPSNFFPDIYEAVFREARGEDGAGRPAVQGLREKLSLIRAKALKNRPIPGSVKERYLAQIRDGMREVKLTEEIFFMRFLQSQGKNRELEQIFRERMASPALELEEWENWLVLEAKMTLAREQAQFIQYRETAREMRRIARGRGRRAVNQAEAAIARGQELSAWMQIVSSHQMEIPTQLRFKLPLRLRGYERLVMVKIGFYILDVATRIAGKEVYRANVVSVQERQLRSCAINAGLAERLRKSGIPVFQRFVNRVIGQLERLQEAAYEAGNYETVIGTMKYLARLLPEKDFKNRVETFGALVSNVSAISIVKRDSFRSEAEFLEALAEAKRNDNTLNVVKTYLKYAFMQMEAEVNPLLCKEYAADLKRYMDNVESDHLQKCFRYIRITYLETDGY